MDANWADYNTATELAEAAITVFKLPDEIAFELAHEVFYRDWDNNPEHNEEA